MKGKKIAVRMSSAQLFMTADLGLIMPEPVI